MPGNWQLSNPGGLDRWFFTRKADPSCLFTFGSRFDGIGGSGAPLTCFMSGEALASHNFHWGGDFYYDKTDAISVKDGSLMFKYIGRFNGSKQGLVWSIGIQPRLFHYAVAVDRLTPEVMVDPLLEQNKKSKVHFEAGAGFFIRKGTKWYAGISSLHLVALTQRTTGSRRSPEMTPQVNALFGFYKVGGECILEYNFGLNAIRKISFYTAGPAIPVSANASIRVHPNGNKDKSDIRKYWFGGGLGTNGILSGDGGMEQIDETSHLPKFRIGCSLSLPVWYRKALFGPNPTGLELILTVPFSPPKKLQS